MVDLHTLTRELRSLPAVSARQAEAMVEELKRQFDDVVERSPDEPYMLVISREDARKIGPGYVEAGPALRRALPGFHGVAFGAECWESLPPQKLFAPAVPQDLPRRAVAALVLLGL